MTSADTEIRATSDTVPADVVKDPLEETAEFAFGRSATVVGTYL